MRRPRPLSGWLSALAVLAGLTAAGPARGASLSGGGEGVAPVALTAPASEPLLTSSPWLSGQAAGDQPVYLDVYPGATYTSRPLRTLSAPAAADGSFSIQVAPGRPDGTYTAVAAQQGGGGIAFSQPVTFRLKARPPALTVGAPRSGTHVAGSWLTLSGRAGTLQGDSDRVSVYLYTLSGLDGRRLGLHTVTARRGSWSLRWPKALSPGLYTAVILQPGAYGHVAALLDRFMLIPARARSGPHGGPRR